MRTPNEAPPSWGTIRDPDIDSEMRRRFERAQRTRISETNLAVPALRPTAGSLRSHFKSEIGRAPAPLENPHLENRVSLADRAKATPASVLLAIVLRDSEPTFLLTQRHADISHGGQWVFPGGRPDGDGEDPLETALRETEEEIGLDRRNLEVLGQLGEYVSHSGYRITPVVAFVHEPFELRPQPGEVEAITEVQLSRLTDPASYFLYRFENRLDRAHFAMDTPTSGVMLTGVTVSIAIGLYRELLRTHPTDEPA